MEAVVTGWTEWIKVDIWERDFIRTNKGKLFLRGAMGKCCFEHNSWHWNHFFAAVEIATYAHII